MADTEKRPGVLGAVSDWLKLLALIVLVGEAVMLAGMALTPVTHPMSSWYPVLMLLFLLFVVAAVVFDRYLTHKKGGALSMRIGDKTLAVADKQSETVPPPTGAIPASLHVDSERGFQFELPKSGGWSRPSSRPLGDYLVQMGVLPGQEAVATFKEVMAVQPLGRMTAEASVLYVTHGEPVTAEVTDRTTSDALETILARSVEVAARRGETTTDEQLAALRQEVMAKKTVRKQFPVQNTFAVMTLDKAFAADSSVPPTLANLFVQNITQSGGPVDKLVADERTILSGSTQTWRHMLVNGRDGELTTYTVNMFTQSDRSIYLITISFSPQTQKSLEVWEELQTMLRSFRMLSQPA